MELSMGWAVICRVCLHEGEMQSIYEKDDKNITICEKIIKCTNIMIKRGMNLPEQICNKCLEDLHVAYRFVTNCESSDAVLQSFTVGQVVTDLIMSSETGEIYKFKPPQGLNVKRIRPTVSPVKYEAQAVTESITGECFTITNIKHDDIVQEQDTPIDDADDNDQHYETYEENEDEEQLDGDIIEETEKLDKSSESDESKYTAGVVIKTENAVTESRYELTENGKVCTIKPVKTNKSRTKASSREKLKVVSAQEVTTKPDGTTVIRVRRGNDEPKPLKICEICGNTYKYKHALESHMRRHRNEKPFSCEICGRSFVINFELRRHMRTHTGQKPYACRFCGRKFSDFGSRIKHERTHTGERPYTCGTCGKSFAYSHVLSSHILTHTGEKRYGCADCGKRFAKSHHLKAHLNTHLKNQNKNIMIKNMPQSSTNLENDEKPIIYQTDEKVYQEVLTVLTAQPKIEQFVDDDDIKVMYTTDENHHAINSIVF